MVTSLHLSFLSMKPEVVVFRVQGLGFRVQVSRRIARFVWNAQLFGGIARIFLELPGCTWKDILGALDLLACRDVRMFTWF